MNGIPWRDTPERYGPVSRALHWGMAALFAWQFLGMGLRLALGRTPVVSLFVGTHASVGTLLMALILLRGAWGLLNARRRPPHGPGLGGAAVLLGHLALYALMLIVPALALLRAFGSGRPFAPFGIPLFAGGERVEALMTPGNIAHGNLAWALLALVAGHVAMAVLHRRRHGRGGPGDVLPRMAGRPTAP